MWLQLQEEWNHIRENLPLCLKNPIPFIVGHTNNTSHFLQSKLGVIDSEDPRLKSVLFLKPCVSSQSNENQSCILCPVGKAKNHTSCQVLCSSFCSLLFIDGRPVLSHLACLEAPICVKLGQSKDLRLWHSKRITAILKPVCDWPLLVKENIELKCKEE